MLRMGKKMNLFITLKIKRKLVFYGGCFLWFSTAYNNVLAGPESFLPRIEEGASINTSSKDENPVFLEADEVSIDEALSTTTARGNVRIIRQMKTGINILQADVITFNEKTHFVTASGNVSILSPEGDVYKATYLELTDDFKEGFIKTIHLLTKDNRRMAAVSAERTDEKITTFSKAIYSPCNLCKEHPETPPLWQIKAIRVVRDEIKGDIDYHDAWLEFDGVPVFYTPYLSHPDPSIKRRSGFLTPYLGMSRDLGAFTGVPYYYVLNDSQDMTITPLFFTKQAPLLIGEYRQRFSNGAWEFLGSITDSKKTSASSQSISRTSKTLRGHVQTKGILNLNDIWRTGFTVNRASDPTYVRRYSFTNVETPQTSSLDSTVYAEGFYDKSYALLQGYSFQPTRQNHPQSQSPLILPLASYAYVGPQGEKGDHFFSNSSLAAITRRVGTNMQRLSVEGGWELPFKGGIGDLYTLTTSLRGDAYNISRFNTGNSTTFKGEKARLFPQATLDWKYPLFNRTSSIPMLIEPNLQFVAAPKGLNNSKIPNEDSLDFEFDETNIFSRDRFPGLDLIDSGQRFNYGTTFEFYPKKIKSLSFFLGQSYQFTQNKFIPQGVGIHRGFSDIIGNFVINPDADTKFRYRVLWDKDNMRARRNEVGVDFGPPVFRVGANYLFSAKNSLDTSFNGKEQISASLGSQFTKYWRGIIQGSRDLGKKGGNLAQSYGIVYEDECFIFKTSLIRTFYQDRDIQPDNIVLFSFTFKTLGEVEFKGLTLGAKNRQEKARQLLN